MIGDYFLQIEHIIREFPNIRSLSLKKKIYNAGQGCISGSIIFENGYRSDFAEVKDTDVTPKVKYRYQYMSYAVGARRRRAPTISPMCRGDVPNRNCVTPTVYE